MSFAVNLTLLFIVVESTLNNSEYKIAQFWPCFFSNLGMSKVNYYELF